MFAGVLAVLAVLARVDAVCATPEDWTVITQPLTLTPRVVGHETVLNEPVLEIQSVPGLMVMRTGRRIWVKRRDQSLAAMDAGLELPAQVDWFTRLCPGGNSMVIALASYSEEQRLRDQATPRGGYVEGPLPMGLLVLHPEDTGLRFERIPRFRVLNRPNPNWEARPENQRAAEPRDQLEAEYNPQTLEPFVQDCRWDGRRLVVAGYGQLARLDLKGREAVLVEYDLEVKKNRSALFLEGET
ncbi:MAG: hypothetical protein OEW39_13570, partial [Deltaproteobacteria bacterium]|nr:hypothetical protein [Deltaproteobacteria bacterium]